MKFSLVRVGLAGFATLVVSAAVWAAELPILAKARARLGPDAALDGLKSIRYVSTLTTTDPKDPTKEITAAVEMIFDRPDRQRITATYLDYVETTALDSYEAWTRVQDPKDASRWRLTLLDAEQVKRLRANTWQSLAYFRGIERIGGRVEDQGTANVDGVACQKVAFIHEPRIIFYRYFDPATGRLVLTETESGASVREEGEMMAGGIRFPKAIITVVKSGDRTQKVTVRHEKVFLNENFPAETFRVPAVPRR